MKPLYLALSLAVASSLAVAQNDPKASFDKMKALAGEWEGTVTTVPAEPSVQGKTARVNIRVTSRGNAVLHEMKIEGIPDNPITMFYLEQDRLRLTHYCDAGNRPRMEAKSAPDAKKLEFDFIDLSGGTEKGHMHNVSFAPADPDHHVEEWTYMAPSGNGHVLARFDLHRKSSDPRP